MRNARIQAIKPLNKVLATYPNMYLALHEGIADPTVATINDQNTSNNLALTVAAPGATQWNATLGNFAPPTPNTTQYIATSDVSAGADAFDALFGDLQNTAWMICLNIDYVGDAAAAEIFFHLYDLSVPTHIFDFRLNPDVGQLNPLLYDSAGAVATQANLVPAADGEQFIVAYVDMRAGFKTSTVYRLTPGTKVHNIVSAQTRSTATNSFVVPASTAGAGAITVGARKISTGYDKFLDIAGMRDLRFINFGQTPPSDIVNLIEELSLNTNVGTRRTY